MTTAPILVDTQNDCFPGGAELPAAQVHAVSIAAPAVPYATVAPTVGLPE